MPVHLTDPEDVPYTVSLRFYVTLALLHLTNHSGTIFFIDTRDVYIQSDPFLDYADDILHFPKESGAYRMKGPFTDNHNWLLMCFGQ